MTAVTTQKRRTQEIPSNIGAPTPFFMKLPLAGFAANIPAADTIELADLPAGSRVVYSSIYNSAVGNGTATATVKLQQVVNATTTDLTGTRAADAVGSTLQNVAPPPASLSYPTKLQLLVGTESLLIASAGYIEVFVLYVTDPNQVS